MNVITGISISYLSSVLPMILIAVTFVGTYKLLSFFGTALVALGILSNLAVSIAIDVYGPISDNAGGISEMCNLGEDV